MKATAVPKQVVLKAENKQEKTSLLVYLCGNVNLQTSISDTVS